MNNLDLGRTQLRGDDVDRRKKYADVVKRSSKYLNTRNTSYEPDLEAAHIFERALGLTKVSFFKLFTHAGWLELVIMLFGVLAAILASMVLPFLILWCGKILQMVHDYKVKELRDCSIRNVLEVELALSVIFGALCFLYHLCFQVAARKQLTKLRIAYFHAQLRADCAWFDNYVDRDLATSMSADVTSVEDGIGETVPKVIFAFLTTLNLIFFGFYLHWQTALIVTLTSPFVVIVVTLKNKFHTKLLKRGAVAYEKAGIVAAEILANIKTVRILQVEQKEYGRYMGLLTSPWKFRNLILKFGLSSGFLWLYPILIGLGARIFGDIENYIFSDQKSRKDIATGLHARISIGKNFAFLSSITYRCMTNRLKVSAINENPINVLVIMYIMCACYYFLAFLAFFEKIGKAREAAAPIFFLIDWDFRITNLPDLKGIPGTKIVGKLQMVDAYFAYPKKRPVNVLHNVRINVYPGQMVALFGPSNCGKSTVLKLFLHLYDVYSGRIVVDTTDLRQANSEWLRSQMGYLPQEPCLFNMTVADNIGICQPSATFEQIQSVSKFVHLYDDILALPKGFDTIVGNKSSIRFSRTQLLKIGLARVILQNPRVYLLDHVVADDFEKSFLEILESLREKHTIMVTSNKFNSIIKSCEVIFVMNHGRIVESGNHDTLLANRHLYFSMLEDVLRSTMAERKRMFTSQLNYYKFAQALTRAHEFHDNLHEFDAHVAAKKYKQSLFVRPELRLQSPFSPITLIGGFQGFCVVGYDNDERTLLVRNSLIRERDLRFKVLPSSFASGTFRGSHASGDPKIGNVGPNNYSAVSSGSKVIPAIHSTKISLDSASVTSSRHSHTRGSAGKKEHRRMKKTRFSKEVSVSHSMGSELFMPSQSTQYSLHEPGSKLEPDMTSSYIFMDDKLAQYLHYPMNSRTDNDSLASEDSYAFWNQYNLKLQVTLFRKKAWSCKRSLGLLSFCWPYVVVTALLACVVGVAAVLIIQPLFKVIHKKSFSDVTNQDLLFLVSMNAVMLISAVIQGLTFTSGSLTVINRMRLAMMLNLLKLELNWFNMEGNDIGNVCHILANNPGTIYMAILLVTKFIFLTVTLIGGVLVFYFLITLTKFLPILIGLAILVPVLAVISYLEIRWEVYYIDRVSASLTTVNHIIFDVVTNIRYVGAGNLSRYFLAWFTYELERTNGIRSLCMLFSRAVMYGVSESFFYMGGVTWVITVMDYADNTEMNLKHVVVLATFFFYTFYPLGFTLISFPDIVSAESALSNVNRLLKPSVDKKHSKISRFIVNDDDPPPEIRFQDVYFDSGEPDAVLRGLTFHIPSGKYVAIVGGNRAEKSEILSLILDLSSPQAGSVYINGIDYQDLQGASVREIIGVVDDDPAFFQTLSVYENIAYGAYNQTVREEEVVEAARIADIDFIIDRFPSRYQTKMEDIQECPETYVFRQRLAVARAAIKKPRLVIVDECTTSLDLPNDIKLTAALMRLKADRTFVVTSERIEPIRNADIIIVVREGRVTEMGTDSELIAARGQYYEQYMAQVIFETNETYIHDDHPRT